MVSREPDRAVTVEFAFEPAGVLVFDAFYLARPEYRPGMAALLGLSVAGTAGAVALAVAGVHPLVPLGCLLVAVLALAGLGAWALSQCRGSPFAAGEGSAVADDSGLVVRPVGGVPLALRWPAFRGWVDGDRVVVLLPASPAGRPLHVIPVGAFDDEPTATAFRELLGRHLGEPS